MENGMFMVKNRKGQLMRLASSDGSTKKKDLITWLIEGGGGDPTIFSGHEEILKTISGEDVQTISVEFNPLKGWQPKSDIVN